MTTPRVHMMHGVCIMIITANFTHPPTHTHTHTHTHTQLVNDMGASLDWFASLHSKQGWKMTQVVMGPMFNQLVCLHPDTVKTILKSGDSHMHDRYLGFMMNSHHTVESCLVTKSNK